MSSTLPDSEAWLARSALVIALYPLLSVVAVSALAVSFAVVLLPIPDPVQSLVALAGVALNLTSVIVLAVLTPLFLAALLYDIGNQRERENGWKPSWGYLLALLVHAGWVYWGWRTTQRLDHPETGFLGEWYYSIIPLVAALILLHYLLDRRAKVGFPESPAGSSG